MGLRNICVSFVTYLNYNVSGNIGPNSKLAVDCYMYLVFVFDKAQLVSVSVLSGLRWGLGGYTFNVVVAIVFVARGRGVFALWCSS